MIKLNPASTLLVSTPSQKPETAFVLEVIELTFVPSRKCPLASFQSSGTRDSDGMIYYLSVAVFCSGLSAPPLLNPTQDLL